MEFKFKIILKHKFFSRLDIECHKQCEPQRLYLKKKIADMEKKLATNQESTIVLDDSLNRIINESPAPQNKRTNPVLEISSEKLNSPTVVSPFSYLCIIKF